MTLPPCITIHVNLALCALSLYDLRRAIQPSTHPSIAQHTNLKTVTMAQPAADLNVDPQVARALYIKTGVVSRLVFLLKQAQVQYQEATLSHVTAGLSFCISR